MEKELLAGIVLGILVLWIIVIGTIYYYRECKGINPPTASLKNLENRIKALEQLLNMQNKLEEVQKQIKELENNINVGKEKS